MLEPYFTKVAEFHHMCFPVYFQKISEHIFYRTTMNCCFGTKKGRYKYWSSIVLLESGITLENIKVQICKFCYKILLGIYFGEVIFKEHLWPRKSNKNIAIEKERNFFWETKKCSAKMLVGKVVPQKITKEFTFVNRTVHNFLCWTAFNALF